LIEINEFIEQKGQYENSINLLKKQNAEDEINLNDYQNQLNILKNEIGQMNKEEESTKIKNTDLISERDALERKSTTLSTQLKTGMELKEIYTQKISSLSILLNSLKIEYEKLLEQRGDNPEDSLSIKNSKIINSFEAKNIEKRLAGTIRNKCFDGIEENFNPINFHEKCDDSALLVLIKTDKKERIGAFTRVSFEGLEIKRDPSTVLFNIDLGNYYPLANSEYSTIVCDPNELPQFGVDLQIKYNGQGINSFPFNYGNKIINSYEDLTEDQVFKIEKLEIYKVDL
jgi:hypothetical protein